MTRPGSLSATVQEAHALLLEIHRLQVEARGSAEDTDDLPRSSLLGPATDQEIDEAERQAGHALPPSYRSFLRLHSGWTHFFGMFTLVGTSTQAAHPVRTKIKETVDEQTEYLRKKLGANFCAAGLAKWEAEQDRFMNLAAHLPIATDFSGELWVYDTRTRRDDGEMTLRKWDISYGAQEPYFATFHEFVAWIRDEAEDLRRVTEEMNQNPSARDDEDDD